MVSDKMNDKNEEAIVKISHHIYEKISNELIIGQDKLKKGGFSHFGGTYIMAALLPYVIALYISKLELPGESEFDGAMQGMLEESKRIYKLVEEVRKTTS